jgi:hypothetical protein
MGIKTPITSEKKLNYEGTFDIVTTYSFLKTYLEDFKHYDITEKELEEKNIGGKKEVKGNYTAELEFNDYYKLHMTFELKMSGKNVVIENNQSIYNIVEGTAALVVNTYIENDHMGKRPQGPLAQFLDKVYSKYVADEKKEAIIKLSMDTSEFLSKFKQTLNYNAK